MLKLALIATLLLLGASLGALGGAVSDVRSDAQFDPRWDRVSALESQVRTLESQPRLAPEIANRNALQIARLTQRATKADDERSLVMGWARRVGPVLRMILEDSHRHGE